MPLRHIFINKFEANKLGYAMSRGLEIVSTLLLTLRREKNNNFGGHL